MNRRCEDLRDRAIREGLNSRDAGLWRIHAKSCRNCRTDIYILDRLYKQVQAERRHLPRREVEYILKSAHEKYAGRPSRIWPAFWGWSLRFACAIAVLFIAIELLRPDAQNRNAATAQSALMHQTPTAAGSDGDEDADSPDKTTSEDLIGNHIISIGSDSYHRELRQRITSLRREIDSCSSNILTSIDKVYMVRTATPGRPLP